MKKRFLLVLFCIIFSINGCSYTNENKNIIKGKVAEIEQTKRTKVLEKSKETKTINKNVTLSIVGDIMAHEWQITRAYDATKDKFDFSHAFQYICPYIQKSDYSIGNLETTLAGSNNACKIKDGFNLKGYTGYPCFNSPEVLATNIVDTGFDLVTTANNHSMDSRSEGVLHTLKVLDEAGLEHVGTYNSQYDKDKPFIKKLNGISLGFSSYTYAMNGFQLPKDKPYLVNTLDMYDESKVSNMLEEVKRMSQQNIDFNVVMLHFGNEYNDYPDSKQREIVKQLFEAGADIILGSHPHVIQPIELHKIKRGGKERTCMVIYSLGNFLSSQRYTNKRPKNTDIGVILKLNLKKDKYNNPYIHIISLIPTYTYWSKKEISVLPVLEIFNKNFNYPVELDNNEKQRIKYSYNHTIKHLISNIDNSYQTEKNEHQYNIMISN